MKKTLITFAAVAFAGSLMAQENRASVGLEVALPMGDWADFYGIGIGGTLGYEIPVSDNLGLMANLGYISFMGKEITSSVTVNGVTVSSTVKTDAQGFIPIQVGAKYYFSGSQEGAYLGLLTGLHMASVKTIELTSSGLEEKSELQSNFSLAPLLGFMVTENIDLGLRYQMIFAKGTEISNTGAITETTVTNSYLGLRAAYMF